ncbi:MAG TPA: hypothetical protein VM848_01235 [Acidimicrobiia bacterium]|nr:hypothetical protein [Acidimicrobiia bacterium]
MGDVFLTAAATIAALMIVTWLVSGLLRNASIVDLIWVSGSCSWRGRSFCATPSRQRSTQLRVCWYLFC